MAFLRQVVVVPGATLSQGLLSGSTYAMDASASGAYWQVKGTVPEGILSRTSIQRRADAPTAGHARALLSGTLYGEDASGPGTWLDRYCTIRLPVLSYSAAGVWEFGGGCTAYVPLGSRSDWSWEGYAIALLDGKHIAVLASAAEFAGQLDAHATGSAYGEGDWEFGGMVTVAVGTEEPCISGDGNADKNTLGGGIPANYVF